MTNRLTGSCGKHASSIPCGEHAEGLYLPWEFMMATFHRHTLIPLRPLTRDTLVELLGHCGLYRSAASTDSTSFDWQYRG